MCIFDQPDGIALTRARRKKEVSAVTLITTLSNTNLKYKLSVQFWNMYLYRNEQRKLHAPDKTDVRFANSH